MALQLFEIADFTVQSPVTSFTFSSIPQGYTDLIIKYTARNTGSSNVFTQLTFNGSGSSYSYRGIFGNGSSVSSFNASTTYIYVGDMDPSSYTANTFSNEEIYIPNYAGSNFKSVSIDSVNENNATAAAAYLTAGLWSNTAAITSLTLTPGGGSFTTNSTFTLYGVL